MIYNGKDLHMLFLVCMVKYIIYECEIEGQRFQQRVMVMEGRIVTKALLKNTLY